MKRVWVPLASAIVLFAAAATGGPLQVSGKEYADLGNGGTIKLWDGLGNTVSVNPGFDRGDVDALAAQYDLFFPELLTNWAALLVTFDGDPNIYIEDNFGVNYTWAVPAQVDSAGYTMIEALEVWGPEGVSDATIYSLRGDPGGCAVLVLGGGCLYTNAAVGAAIGLSSGAQFDLDALMAYGDQIVFSIRPVSDPTGVSFDGGEIWHWDGKAASASFLNHGGHLWDTAFDVMGTFGVNSENVASIEAVPEPASMALVVGSLGLLAAAIRRRR
ncbi:MAG: PEP-CTERM sorting domain-containing protein [Acidobacteria bacterium]|nr:PEP-CTERM sorting domain-containing protein [Acidobacteriota bacterium]